MARLDVGTRAPAFTLNNQDGEKVALKDFAGERVVLYFYPKAFTPGCTVEAHEFADAVDKFQALGATVIGVSHDGIDKLNQFSVSECRGKFAVLADPDQKIIKAFDVVWAEKPQLASRTSYVISPKGKILYTFTDLKPELHVANTLAAVQAWKAGTSQ